MFTVFFIILKGHYTDAYTDKRPATTYNDEDDGGHKRKSSK
jgi:hypothetical protein